MAMMIHRHGYSFLVIIGLALALGGGSLLVSDESEDSPPEGEDPGFAGETLGAGFIAPETVESGKTFTVAAFAYSMNDIDPVSMVLYLGEDPVWSSAEPAPDISVTVPCGPVYGPQGSWIEVRIWARNEVTLEEGWASGIVTILAPPPPPPTDINVDLDTANIPDGVEETQPYNIFLNEDFDQQLNPTGDPVSYDLDCMDGSFSGDAGSEIGSLQITTDAPAGSQVLFTTTGEGQVNLFNDGAPVPLGMFMPVSTLGALRVEGVGEGELSLTATVTGDGRGGSDTIRIKVVRLNLSLVTIGPRNGEDRYECSTRDAALRLNEDDDNHNGVMDYLEDPAVPGEDDDLFEIRIEPTNALLGEVQGGVVYVEYSSRMRLWESRDRSRPAQPSYPADHLPLTLYVEGTEPSFGLLHHWVRVYMTLDNGVTCEDMVYFTVWRVTVTKCDYNWQPVANSLTERGSYTTFDASVYPEVPDELRFVLSDVSNEPGLCLNGPDYSPTPPAHHGDLDLRFESNLNAGFDSISDTEVMRRRATFGRAHVSCFDWGAHGRITATVIVGRFSGNAVVVEGDGDIVGFATIPQDENENFIPDSATDWDGDAVAHGGADDADALPENQAGSGDGLSRYEEWRGVMIQRKHRRTNIAHKDLFIYDPNGLARDSYLNTASRLSIHYIRQLEMSDVGAAPDHRRINFNRGSLSHGDQYCLHVIDALRDAADDRLSNWGNAHGVNGPRSADPEVHVYVERINEDAAAIATSDGVTSITTRSGTAKLRDLRLRLVRRTSTHEPGHGIHIEHHSHPNEMGGGRRCVMRYLWNDIRLVFDTYHYPGTPPPYDPWLKNISPWPTIFCGQGSLDNCYGQIDVSDN